MFEDVLCILGNIGNWDKNKGIKILILILIWFKKNLVNV